MIKLGEQETRGSRTLVDSAARMCAVFRPRPPPRATVASPAAAAASACLASAHAERTGADESASGRNGREVALLGE